MSLDRYLPTARLQTDDLLSAETVRQWHRNARWLFHTIHGFPCRWMNRSSTPADPNTRREANAGFSHYFNLPANFWHPWYQGMFQKTARRNTLRVYGYSACPTTSTLEARIILGSTTVWSGQLPKGGGTQIWGPPGLTIDLTPFSLAAGAYFPIYVDIRQTAGVDQSIFVTVAPAELYDAGGIPAGFPTLPVFTGATSLTASDLNALVTAQEYLFDRIQEASVPATAGYLEQDATELDLADGWVTIRHGFIRHLADHTTLALAGRLVPTDGQQLRVMVNGQAAFTQTVNGPVIIDPWEPTGSYDGTGIPSGTDLLVELQYLRTSVPRPPKAAATRYSLRLLEARRTSLPPAVPAILSDDASSVDLDLRPYLQGIRDMLSSAYGAFQGKASVIDRDWPMDWQWEGPAGWNRHIVGGVAAGNKGLDPERQGERMRLPACFQRTGDLLTVFGRNVRIHWGPFKPAEAGKNPRELSFAYSQQLTQGEADTSTSVWLDTLDGGNGATIPNGQAYYITADRLLDARERIALVES